MGDNSAIEWTDATWTPIRGKGINRWFCQKVSPGCDNCYASRLNVRFGGQAYLEPTCKDDMREAVEKGLIRLDEKALALPRHWKKPRKVFVCSMTDLFGEWVPDDWIDRVLSVMLASPQHAFQVLTKRAKRMRDYMSDAVMRVHWSEWPLPNVWLGVSVESQAFAWRLNYLAQTPAAVRFVSAEPLLGPLDLRKWLLPEAYLCGPLPTSKEGRQAVSSILRAAGRNLGGNYVDWVITGGESGPNHRPLDREWVRRIHAQCETAGVAHLHKQNGGRTPKSGGRLIDGQLWDAYPQVAA